MWRRLIDRLCAWGRQQQRFQALLEHLPVTVLLFRAPDQLTYLNRPTFLGHPSHTLLNPNVCGQLIHPDDYERVIAHWHAHQNDAMPIDFRVRSAASVWEWVRMRNTVSGAQAGGCPGEIVITLAIITEQKQFEEQLQQQARIINHVSDAIIVTDAEYQILSWNEGAERIYGWRADEVIGQYVDRIVRVQYNTLSERDQIIARMSVDGHWQGEHAHLRRDGSLVDIQTYATLIRDHEGVIQSIVAVNRDITGRKQAEVQTLRLALERERVLMLQRFMGDVAHDFRTPITTTKLSLYLLERAQADADRARHLGVLEAQIDRLERLVSDLFNMARLDESRTDEFTFGINDINPILRDMAAAHTPLIESKGHTLHLELDEDLPHILCDPNQLDRALTNLLINAIHYTPAEGEITVRSRAAQHLLIIEFIDTGIGIEPADLPYIFERFYRADSARGTERGLMGLGLSIAEKIIKTHDGRIEVDSEPGAGSTFRVILPTTYLPS